MEIGPFQLSNSLLLFLRAVVSYVHISHIKQKNNANINWYFCLCVIGQIFAQIFASCELTLTTYLHWLCVVWWTFWPIFTEMKKTNIEIDKWYTKIYKYQIKDSISPCRFHWKVVLLPLNVSWSLLIILYRVGLPKIFYFACNVSHIKKHQRLQKQQKKHIKSRCYKSNKSNTLQRRHISHDSHKITSNNIPA